jgi:hypothetical protein
MACTGDGKGEGQDTAEAAAGMRSAKQLPQGPIAEAELLDSNEYYTLKSVAAVQGR